VNRSVALASRRQGAPDGFDQTVLSDLLDVVRARGDLDVICSGLQLVLLPPA
jgi:hypothetical protein